MDFPNFFFNFLVKNSRFANMKKLFHFMHPEIWTKVPTLGLDHHDALLIFRANVLKHAKSEGFFQQRELRKTYTAREVCVGMAG